MSHRLGPFVPINDFSHSSIIKAYQESSDESPSRSLLSSSSYANRSPQEGAAALKNLEVQSVSTDSVPISIPYYYLANGNDSFDTVNLLNGPGSNTNSTPQYSNTSHLNNAAPGKHSPIAKIDESTPTHFTKENSPVKNDDEVFNQVPKRFSQFIIDQKNPFTAQRLDNLSAESSTSDLNPANLPRTGSKRRNQTQSVSSGQAAISTYHSNVSSGEISNSMGSQATIFSTRQELEPDLSNSKIRQRPKKSRTRTRLYSDDSDGFSSLSRRKAIKFKNGSWLYRLRIRINRMVTKLKNLRFKNFTASSKRTGSLKKSKKSHFFVNRKQSIRGNISNPNTNPTLGTKRAVTVGTVDDELKYLAGAPPNNLNINKQDHSAAGIYPLSSYIDLQQNTLSEINKNRLSRGYEVVSSGNYAPAHESLDPASSGKYENEKALSEASTESMAPAPPPHLVKNPDFVQSNPDIQVIELWKTYLKHVLCKRIQIRQEINLFQSFVIEQERNSRKLLQNQELQHANVAGMPRLAAITDEIETVSDFSTSLASKTVTDVDSTASYTISDTGSDVCSYQTLEVDSTVEKFNNKYQNRRSVLGEMLDYDSDDSAVSTSTGESVSEVSGSKMVSNASSMKYSPSFTSSMASDIGINKKYGTITRRVSKLSAASNPSALSPMRRSNGIKTGLNEL